MKKKKRIPGRKILPAIIQTYHDVGRSGSLAVFRKDQPRHQVTLRRGVLDVVADRLPIGAEIEKNVRLDLPRPHRR